MTEPRPPLGADRGAVSAEATRAQRRHLRRILCAFIVVVVLLPVAALGGRWGIVLVPLLLVAACALREALRLRRLGRLHGAVRGR